MASISVSDLVSEELCEEAQKRYLFVPPNLVWRMGIVLWHERVSFIATRDTGRTSIVTVCDEEETDTPFRDFQKFLYSVLSELPDEYSYFDHIGTVYARNGYLLLEIHFSSPEQIANCLNGLESILTQKLMKCFVSALEGVDMNASLVIFSNLDSRLKQVLHENTSIAYNLVYNEKPDLTLCHIDDPSLYAQIKAAYAHLVKSFPDFFGETGPVDIFPSTTATDTVSGDPQVTTVSPKVTDSFNPQPDHEVDIATTESFGGACSLPSATEGIYTTANSIAKLDSKDFQRSTAGESVSRIDQIATDSNAVNTKHCEASLPDITNASNHPSTLETAESPCDSPLPNINWEEVTDQEMILIAEMIPPDQYITVGLHLGLSKMIIDRAQADSSDSMHYILTILHKAKLNCLASRNQLAVALAKSNLSTAAKVVDPAVDLNQVSQSKTHQHSQKTSQTETEHKLLVDGTLSFYDRELAREHLKNTQPITFWAALHRQIATAIKESLTRYQIPVLSTTVGSFIAKIQFQGFNQAFQLANDIATGHFVKVVGQKLRVLGYKNHVAVKLQICSSEVTPFNCRNLYLKALLSCEEFKAALEEKIRSRGYQHHVSIESNIDQDVHSFNIEICPPSSQPQEQTSPLPPVNTATTSVTADDHQHGSNTAASSDVLKSLSHSRTAVKQGSSAVLQQTTQKSPQRQLSDDLKTHRSKSHQISVSEPSVQRSISLDPSVISRRDILPTLHVKSGKKFQERLKPMQPDKSTGYQIMYSDANIFFYLIRKGESAKVQQQIEKGADLSQTDCGHMPIHVAAHYGRYDIVKMIIMHGGSVDVRTNTKLKLSSLHIAAHYGHLNVVQVIVEQGADIEAHTSEGLTPLAMAASEGFANITEFLLKHGANVNSQCNKKMTPLNAAAFFGRKAVVQVLLKHNADFTLLDSDSQTAIHSAIVSKNPEILKLLLEANPKALSHPLVLNSIPPPVITVCKLGNVEMLEIMLQYGADINTVDPKSYMTPLIVACIDGNTKLIDVLTNSGAKIDKVVPNIGTPLHAAVETGQKQAAEKLLQLGFPPDTIDSNGVTPLMKAIEWEKIEIAELLLKCGANVSVEHPKTGRPLLHKAAARNQTKMLELLLAHGADINQLTPQGSTALHLAATFGSEDAIALLCSNNCNVNIQNVVGLTPLAAAIQSKKFAGALMLLKYNPDVNKCDSKQRSPLYAATDFHAIEVVQRLLKLGAKSDIPDINGLTPIQMACQRGYNEILKLMVEADPHVLEVQTKMEEPLIFVAIVTSSSTLQILLQAGANPNVRHPNQLTPLHEVCRLGNLAMLQQLLTYGADPKLQSPIGTALHIAVLVGQYQCAKQLLEFGVDPNATAGEEKATPLILAAELDHPSLTMIQLLIDHKADLNAALQKNGYTAMHRAASYNYAKVVKLLIDKGADINKVSNLGYAPLHMAASSGGKEVIEVLLEAKCRLNIQDGEGLTPLMRAIHDEHFEIAFHLINYGADVSLCTDDGLYALHLAVPLGNKDLVEKLLLINNSPDVQQRNGVSPLHMAISNGDNDISKVLLSNGAKVNIMDSDQTTPLHIAASNNNLEAAKLLLKYGADPSLKDHEWKTPGDKTISKDIKDLLFLKLNTTTTNPVMKTPNSSESASIVDIDIAAARIAEADCLDRLAQQLKLPQNEWHNIMSSHDTATDMLWLC